MLILTLDHITEIGFRLLLWILYMYINQLAPYIRHIEEEELWYYRYPSTSSFIPIKYLYVLLIGIPSITYCLHYLCSSKKNIRQEIRNQFYGISLAYGITGISTALLKVIIGRPRPNFFFRCFPDGVGMHVENCTGEWEGQMDGRKSFPSAHSSFSFTGMVFVTCYLLKAMKLSKPCFGRGILMVVSLSPMFVALVVSVSRICDYHHHSSDVLGGGILGMGVALLVFYHYKDVNPQLNEKLRREFTNIRDVTNDIDVDE